MLLEITNGNFLLLYFLQIGSSLNVGISVLTDKTTDNITDKKSSKQKY